MAKMLYHRVIPYDFSRNTVSMMGAAVLYPLSLQIALCVAIVASVSPNCTSIADKMESSSSSSLQAMAFAAAVIEAVSSHAFILVILSYALGLYYAPDGQIVIARIDKQSRAVYNRDRIIRPDRRIEMMQTDYELMIKQARAIVEDVPHLTANLANLSALIYTSLEDINWAGFYLTQGDRLILAPFQGKVACVEIPYGRGVCGTAAQKDAIQLVPDVHLFPGHIACDSASRSEIVVPIHRAGKVVGVLDIDSPIADRFTEHDRAGLERLVGMMEELLFR